MNGNKKRNLKAIVISLILIIISSGVLTLGVLLIPPLSQGEAPLTNQKLPPETQGDTTAQGSLSQDTMVNTKEEFKVSIEPVKLEYRDGYITTIGDVLHLEYSNMYGGASTSIENPRYVNEITSPSYLPEGYFWEQHRTLNQISISTFSSETDEGFPLHIYQGISSTKSITKSFTDKEKLYTVNFDGFFGILSEYEDELHFTDISRGIHRYLTFYDSEYYYCVGGIEFERDELIKVAMGLEPLKMTEPSVKVERNDGFPAEFVNYPVGYIHGYADTLEGFIFKYMGDKNANYVSTYAISYCGNTEDIEGHLMPRLEGYKIFKYCDGSYIYTQNGEEMFLFSVQGHTNMATVTYNTARCGFYKTSIGDNMGLLIAEKSAPQCLTWSDGKYDYSLEPISDKMDAQKLLEAARSLGKSTQSFTEYSDPEVFKWVTDEEHGNVKFQTAFIDKGDYYTVLVTNYAPDQYPQILANLYARDSMQTVGPTPLVMSYDISGIKGRGGIILKYSLSKTTFKNASDFYMNFISYSFGETPAIAWTTHYSLNSGKVVIKAN